MSTASRLNRIARRHYRRSWDSVITHTGLGTIKETRRSRGHKVGFPASLVQGTHYVETVRKMPQMAWAESSGHLDRVGVFMIPGQRPNDWEKASENLAHGFGAHACRVRSAGPGQIVLEFTTQDTLSMPFGALTCDDTDLSALPVGITESGNVWTIRLHGCHILLGGASGSGKSGCLWGIVRALIPSLTCGNVRVIACDPKHMELSLGAELFRKYGTYAAEVDDIVNAMETAVNEMKARAKTMAGKERSHTPSRENPFTVLIMDELAYLLAYTGNTAMQKRFQAALSALLTQGRAVGYAVIGAAQDPRQETLKVRNLFTNRIALRLDSPDQADMVLGQGMRDKGALCDLISVDTPGVGYVKEETSSEPIRVRAAYIDDDEIFAMVDKALSRLSDQKS